MGYKLYNLIIRHKNSKSIQNTVARNHAKLQQVNGKYFLVDSKQLKKAHQGINNWEEHDRSSSFAYYKKNQYQKIASR